MRFGDEGRFNKSFQRTATGGRSREKKSKIPPGGAADEKLKGGRGRARGKNYEVPLSRVSRSGHARHVQAPRPDNEAVATLVNEIDGEKDLEEICRSRLLALEFSGEEVTARGGNHVFRESLKYVDGGGWHRDCSVSAAIVVRRNT
jgi:hypothetical protein